MRLWIIRHAHAEDGADDDVRPLSSKGQAQAAALGSLFRQAHAPEPQVLWHSGLLRARETSELLKSSAHWAVELQEKAGLRPYDNPAALAEEIAKAGSDLAIVGHNPHLGCLASLLVLGDPDADAFLVKKAACICLENGIHAGPSGAFRRWSVSWMLTPEVVPG